MLSNKIFLGKEISSKFYGFKNQAFISCSYSAAKTVIPVTVRKLFFNRCKQTEISKNKWGKTKFGKCPRYKKNGFCF